LLKTRDLGKCYLSLW